MGQHYSTGTCYKEEIIGEDEQEEGILRRPISRRKHNYFVSSGNLERLGDVESILDAINLSPRSDSSTFHDQNNQDRFT